MCGEEKYNSKVNYVLLSMLLAVTVVIAYYVFLSVTAPPHEMALSIRNLGASGESDGMSYRVLALSNQSAEPLELMRTFTRYWTSESGHATNWFVPIETNLIIAPGKSESIRIHAPSGRGSWSTSFGFKIVPRRGLIPPLSVHDDESVYITLGPRIESGIGTNARKKGVNP